MSDQHDQLHWHQRRNLVETALTLLLVCVLLVVTARTLLPFLSIFMWATILVVASAPVAARITKALGGRNGLVALVIGSLYFVVLGLPLLYVSTELEGFMTSAWENVAYVAAYGLPEPPPWLQEIPVIGTRLAKTWRVDAHHLAAVLTSSQSTLIGLGRLAIIQATDLVTAVVEIVSGIILATMLLATGKTVPQFLLRFARAIGGDVGEAALATARGAIMAVALGVVTTALAESVLAGVGLAVAGVPNVAPLGFLMFACCTFQLGSLVVCLPVSAWLWWNGAPLWAGFVAVWSILVASGVYGVLRPYVLAKSVKLPGFLMFFGVMGGLLTWGFSGMFIGASAVAILWTMMAAWVGTQPAECEATE